MAALRRAVDISMHRRRSVYYLCALVLSMLGAAYCVLVYRAGERYDAGLGLRYVLDIPNFFFFYVLVLPFFVAGVLYLGFEDRDTRFFGPANDSLAPRLRDKVRRFKKILPVLCLACGVLIAVQDAGEKNYTLAPHAYRFATAEGERAVLRFYACARAWRACEAEAAKPVTPRYADVLRQAGVAGARVTGFDGPRGWAAAASWLYTLESLLNLLATLVVGLFTAEVFLLVIMKNYSRPATRNLVVWMLVLISFWFPADIYSAWALSLDPMAMPPAVFLFGGIVLASGILLIVFVRTERNELAKYGSAVAAVFSFALGTLTYAKPQAVHATLEQLRDVGTIYPLVVLALAGVALYLVTDYFIDSYEQEIDEKAPA